MRSKNTALTSRQIQIVKLISEGHTIAQIASEVGLSEKTIEYHSIEARGKIGCPNIALLTRWAIKEGITQI